jgi:hypothetical protein
MIASKSFVIVCEVSMASILVFSSLSFLLILVGNKYLMALLTLTVEPPQARAR